MIPKRDASGWTYVPGLGRVSAEAKAGGVSTVDVDQPVLGGGRARSRVDGQDLLPVFEGEMVLDVLDGLRRRLDDGGRGCGDG